MKQLAVMVVLGTSVAVAQPHKPGPGVPTRAVPCAPAGSELLLAGADPVVCWDAGCMKLDVSMGTAVPTPKPGPAKTWHAPRAEVKGDRVCLGATCKKLGKKLVAAIGDPEAAPEATTDLEAVVVGGKPWSVAGDKPLTLAGVGKKLGLVGVQVAGPWLVADAADCAGPCTRLYIHDSRGRVRGKEGEGGGTVIQLDAKRFFVLGEYARLQVWDLATAKPRGQLVLSGDPGTATAVSDGQGKLYVYYRPMPDDGMHLVELSFEAYTGQVSVAESMVLPHCAP